MREHSLRVVFFIQGEGRGHMTQALAMKRILEDAGHTVVAAFMGENPENPIPDFFLDGFQAPVHRFLAPVWVVDPLGKGIRPWDSLFHSIRQFPEYWVEFPRLREEFFRYRPHLVVNFLDLIGGVFATIYHPEAPIVAVGHHFLFFHPEFRTPRDERFQVGMIRRYTHLTSMGASLRLGLSFSPLADLPERRVRIVPPLLRQEVLEAEATTGRHILSYLLNPGYAEEIKAWHRDHPDTEVHCFWANPEAASEESPWPGLTFHRLDGQKFLDLLTSCRGYASTAGFESVCEAAYLGKPISLVPTEKHVEQLCNAMDAQRAGLATWRRDFDLTDFLRSLDTETAKDPEAYRSWVRRGPELFLRLLETAARRGDVMESHARPARIRFGPGEA